MTTHDRVADNFRRQSRMTLNKHVLREVHLGGRLRDGMIAWRDDTQAAALELVLQP
jgi:hypothetical protein